MLISPLPGASSKDVLQTLSQVHVKVLNLRSGPAVGGSYRWLVDYLTWVTDAARMLGSQISRVDIDRLVLTKRYELLLSMIAHVTPATEGDVSTKAQSSPVVNDLLSTEITERVDAFDEALKDFHDQIDRWYPNNVLVGMDTGVYINYPVKLAEMDVGELTGVRGCDIHLLVPMVVVEELDSLKRHKNDHVRWRAGHTIGLLDSVLLNPRLVGQIRRAMSPQQAPDGISWDAINVELLFDPPDHVRLSINDYEIVDRLIAVQALAGRPVTFITYDANQAFKARAAGLTTIRLRTPVEDEPEPEALGKKKSGRANKRPLEAAEKSDGGGKHGEPLQAGP